MDASRRPDWIAAAQLRALDAILAAFDTLGVPYAATGGLAGNLHGSHWPLHDLDFDVPSDALPRLAAAFAPAVTFGPAAYRDDEFVLDLLTLQIEDTSIDLAAAESVCLVRAGGGTIPSPTDLRRTEVRPLAARDVRVIPLADLIAYKRIIGRYADVADLEHVATRSRGSG